MLSGYKPRGSRRKYYCGKTKSTRFVYERLKDKGHHINELREQGREIWIGMITSVKPTDSNIFTVENIITSAIASLEVADKDMLNKINMSAPTMDSYVINLWHFPDEELTERGNLPRQSVAYKVPDLIIYDAATGNFRGSRRIQRTLFK